MVDLKSRQISNKSSVYSRRTKDYSLITPTGKNQFRSKETKADDIFSKGVAEKKTDNDKVAANNKVADQLMLSQGKSLLSIFLLNISILLANAILN